MKRGTIGTIFFVCAMITGFGIVLASAHILEGYAKFFFSLWIPFVILEFWFYDIPQGVYRWLTRKNTSGDIGTWFERMEVENGRK